VLCRQPLPVRAVLSYRDLLGIPKALGLGDPIKFTRAFRAVYGGCHGPSLCGKCKKLITDREDCPPDSG